jgi:hypothetical protein
MTSDMLADMIKDWNGFEKLVAQLHETGTVIVQHNVTLIGKSGAPRQIDVLVRHTEGLYEHLIVIECKYRNSHVERLHVDALATTIKEVGASKGVIFSTKGFQSGAITQAEHDNISLFLLREPTDDEWGRPGRIVDVWLQIISFGIGNFQTPGALASGVIPPNGISLDMDFSFPKHATATPMQAKDQPDKTFEEFIVRLARRAVTECYLPIKIDFDGTHSGIFRRIIPVTIIPKSTIFVFKNLTTLHLSKIAFDLGLKVEQSRFQIDRSEPYAFALAVENCVQHQVTFAMRNKDAVVTELVPKTPPVESAEPVFESGSLVSVWAMPLEEFSVFDGALKDPSKGPHREISL